MRDSRSTPWPEAWLSRLACEPDPSRSRAGTAWRSAPSTSGWPRAASVSQSASLSVRLPREDCLCPSDRRRSSCLRSDPGARISWGRRLNLGSAGGRTTLNIGRSIGCSLACSNRASSESTKAQSTQNVLFAFQSGTHREWGEIGIGRKKDRQGKSRWGQRERHRERTLRQMDTKCQSTLSARCREAVHNSRVCGKH